jgi:hypothetical protein
MTCVDCTQAAERPWHIFSSGCNGCEARGLARSPQYAESKRLGRLTGPYRDLLARLSLTHDQVRAAEATDAVKGKP